MTNIERYSKSREGMTMEQRNRMDDFFIGWISVGFDASEWQRAIEYAKARSLSIEKEAAA